MAFCGVLELVGDVVEEVQAGSLFDGVDGDFVVVVLAVGVRLVVEQVSTSRGAVDGAAVIERTLHKAGVEVAGDGHS